MADRDFGVRVVAFSRPDLTADSVASIASTLQSDGDVRAVVLDCKVLTSITPAGLASLLEFGKAASGLREMALAGLSRTLTLIAVDVGLAERFAIFVNAEAALLALAPSERDACAH